MEQVEVVARRAEALLELGRVEAAETLLAQALAADPGYPEALALLVRCHLAAERHAEAASVAGRLLAVRPDDRHGLCGLALARLRAGDARGAAAPARQAATGHPDDPAVLLILARVLAALPAEAAETPGTAPGGLAGALEVVDRAAELTPGAAEPLAVRAQLLAGDERWPDSEQAALAALAVTPDDASTRLLLAAVRAMRGDLSGYHRDATDALRDRHDPDVLRLVVTITEALGLPDEMLPTYRAALTALDQPDITAPLPTATEPRAAAGGGVEVLGRQAELAGVLRHHGQVVTDDARADPVVRGRLRERAAALVAGVLAAEPGHVGARRVRAELARDGGDPAAALEGGLALLADGDREWATRLLVCRCQRELGDPAAALATLGQDGGRHDGVAARHVQEAHCLRELGRPAEALAAVRRAADLDPTEPYLWLLTADCARDLDDPALAESALRTGVAERPDDPARLVLLARLLADQDRWPEAWPLLTTAARSGAVPAEGEFAPSGAVPAGDAMVLYGVAVGQLGDALTAAAGDATGPEPVAADLTETVERADRALDVAGLLLADRSMVAPVAEVLQDLVDAATGTVPDDLLAVTRRAHRMLTADPAGAGTTDPAGAAGAGTTDPAGAR